MDLVLPVMRRPVGMANETWAALTEQMARLTRALRDSDKPLAVGTAKEIVESTARAVLDARGQQAASGDEYAKVLAGAHTLLEYQPGPGLALDSPVRAIASDAKKVAGRLRELRNDLGTGHGRTVVPVVADEAVEMAVEAALLWTRWALRRLEHLIAGAPVALVRDLRESTFSTGDLAKRLQAANLPALDQDDQRALGLAVGQRAARGTFMVRIDGVDACIEDPDTAAWPDAYREGVVEGLFLNHAGQVQVDDPHSGTTTQVQGPGLAAAVIASHSDPAAALNSLHEKIWNAGWSPSFAPRLAAVVTSMRASAILLSGTAQTLWLGIANTLAERGAAV